MNYKTIRSGFINDNQNSILTDCERVMKKSQRLFPETNPSLSTNESEMSYYKRHEGYLLYNIFSAAAPSKVFYGICEDLIDFIFSFCKEDKLYLQAWLNYQTSEQVLDWHRHTGYSYHGYVSIDPKNTITEFETFEVENEVGLMYIGECGEMHRVLNKEAFSGRRITIGFDVIKLNDFFIDNMGFIPIFRRCKV